MFTGSYDTNTSLQLLLNDHVLRQSMFDEYYVVHLFFFIFFYSHFTSQLLDKPW